MDTIQPPPSSIQLKIERTVFSALRASRKSGILAKSWGVLFKNFNPIHPERHRPDGPYRYYDKMRAQNPDGIAKEKFDLGWVAYSNNSIQAILGNKDFGKEGIERLTRNYPYTKLDRKSIDIVERMFLLTNGEEHDQLRDAVAEPFRRTSVTGKQQEVDELATTLLQKLNWDTQIELMEDFANQLPNHVIAKILGYTENYAKLQELSSYFADIIEPFRGFDPEKMDQTITEFSILSEELIQGATEDSGTFLGELAQKAKLGEISNEDLISTVILLIFAGYETTSSMLGNAVVVLDKYPQQRMALKEQVRTLEAAEPNSPEYTSAKKYLKSAIAELIRYDASSQLIQRIVMEDTDLTVDGKTFHFKKGDEVFLLLGAANRDPETYGETRNILNLERGLSDSIKNYSFGFGVHSCIGRALAEMELEAGLKTLYGSAAPEFTVVEKEVKHSSTLRSHKKVVLEKVDK